VRWENQQPAGGVQQPAATTTKKLPRQGRLQLLMMVSRTPWEATMLQLLPRQCQRAAEASVHLRVPQAPTPPATVSRVVVPAPRILSLSSNPTMQTLRIHLLRALAAVGVGGVVWIR